MIIWDCKLRMKKQKQNKNKQTNKTTTTQQTNTRSFPPIRLTNSNKTNKTNKNYNMASKITKWDWIGLLNKKKLFKQEACDWRGRIKWVIQVM